MKPEPMILPRNCGNCQHFDGDCHCAIPPAKGMRLIPHIMNRHLVVCTKHEPVEPDPVEGAAV